jgi:predicted nucleotidyltransferase
MKIPTIHPDLKEFLRCLKQQEVRFVVGGSYVMAVLGRPRFTKDIDILVEPSAENAARLSAALHEFGYTELARAARSHFAREDRMATLGVPPVAIDILTSFTGLSFAEAWQGRTMVDIDGEAIPFLGLAQFVKTKRATGRSIDIADLALLEQAGLLDRHD